MVRLDHVQRILIGRSHANHPVAVAVTNVPGMESATYTPTNPWPLRKLHDLGRFLLGVAPEHAFEAPQRDTPPLWRRAGSPPIWDQKTTSMICESNTVDNFSLAPESQLYSHTSPFTVPIAQRVIWGGG